MKRLIVILSVTALVALWLIMDRDQPWGTRTIPYSEFKHSLAQGAVESCQVESRSGRVFVGRNVAARWSRWACSSRW